MRSPTYSVDLGSEVPFQRFRHHLVEGSGTSRGLPQIGRSPLPGLAQTLSLTGKVMLHPRAATSTMHPQIIVTQRRRELRSRFLPGLHPIRAVANGVGGASGFVKGAVAIRASYAGPELVAGTARGRSPQACGSHCGPHRPTREGREIHLRLRLGQTLCPRGLDPDGAGAAGGDRLFPFRRWPGSCSTRSPGRPRRAAQGPTGPGGIASRPATPSQSAKPCSSYGGDTSTRAASSCLSIG